MDNEYINHASTGNNNPEAYQYPPTDPASYAPEYQQTAYQQPVYLQPVYQQPVYPTPYGENHQQAAQPPYGTYGQPQNPYAGYGQPPYGAYGHNAYPAPHAAQPPRSANVFATLGMIFGIIGASLFWFPVIDIFSMVLSIVGIPFSAIGMKSRSGKAVAGLVTSIIGAVLGLICVSCYSEAGVF